MSNVVTEHPLNRHVSWEGLEHDITPVGEFFCRNHNEFPAPPELLDWAGQALKVEDLGAMPQVEYAITLECAGNGRTEFSPVPKGTPWGIRGMSTGRFRGVLVSTLIERFPPPDGAEHIIFQGADEGEHGLYERSLSIEEARDFQAIIALEMNGEALPLRHGAPFRLVVPRYYAMTSVKWLVQARYSPVPSSNYFQVEDYLVDYRDAGVPVRPATVMKPKSIIVSPTEGGRQIGTSALVFGRAWSGEGVVTGVTIEVSGPGGDRRVEAELGPDLGPFAWRAFQRELVNLPAGHHKVRSFCRVGDQEQPAEARWNAQGYENNSAHEVTFETFGKTFM